MKSFSYIIAPFIAWIAAGSLKFIANCIKSKSLAFKAIGYGGFPSTHATIASTCCFLIGFKESFLSPLFCIALTFSFIVLLDAGGLRKHIEKHAISINSLLNNKLLREKMGHSFFELAAGVLLGLGIGFLLASLP